MTHTFTDEELKAHDAEVAAAARAALLSEAIQYSNKRATPAGPFVWSVTLGELEQIINRANKADR